MISLAPLFQPPLDIKIGQSSEARDVSHALAIGAVTGIAGNDVGFRDPLHEDPFSLCSERTVAVIGGFRPDRREIISQITHVVLTKRGDCVPHILPGKRIMPRMLVEALDLAHDILRTLSGKPWRNRVT